MNSGRLVEIISNPELMDNSDIMILEKLVKEHPYFQMAHVLLLYHLKKYNREKFDQQLQESAIHISDRKNLFNLLNQNTFEKSRSSKEKNLSDLLIDEPVEFQFGNTKPVITINEPVDKTVASEGDAKPELLEIDNIVAENFIGQTESDKIELNDKETVNGTNENTEEGKGFSLIDKFIEENPAFMPNKLDLNEIREDISVNSIQEDDSLVTETLAAIFEMQKLNERAISVYEKLILKFPEKSTYFASRINELKKNIK